MSEVRLNYLGVKSARRKKIFPQAKRPLKKTFDYVGVHHNESAPMDITIFGCIGVQIKHVVSTNFKISNAQGDSFYPKRNRSFV